MKLLAQYADPFWEDEAIESIRFTVRVLLQNQAGHFGLLKIVGEDGLGTRQHFETCGGGVEGDESFIEAAQRELMEEMGIVAKEFSEVGVIIDRLNPLKRLTLSVYVHAIVASENHGIQRTESEEILIDSIVWMSAADVIQALSKAYSPIDAYVHRRDLRAFVALFENQNQGG